MSTFFRAPLFLAPATLFLSVPAQAQLQGTRSPSAFSIRSSIVSIESAEYTGRVRYGDTGKPAAGIRVYFERFQSIDGRLPAACVTTTDAAGVFHLSRYAFPISKDDIVWFEVDDPRNLYAAEVVQGCLPVTEETLGMDGTFPTLAQPQYGIVNDDPYPDGILRFVPRSNWQGQSSAFITLQTDTFVAGAITDMVTGRAVSGVRVYASGPHNEGYFERSYDGPLANAYATITDADGRYRLPVMPGKCELKIDCQTPNGENDHRVAFIAVRRKTSAVDLTLSPDEIARLKREESKMRKYNKEKHLDDFRVSRTFVGPPTL